MKRPKKSRPTPKIGPQSASDGWILFKRLIFCTIGFLFAATPVYWALERDHEWSIGMSIMCVIGVGFFALGIFGSRRLVDEADIAA